MGPGTTNLVTGIANAFDDCAQVVAIGGSSAIRGEGLGAFSRNGPGEHDESSHVCAERRGDTFGDPSNSRFGRKSWNGKRVAGRGLPADGRVDVVCECKDPKLRL